MSVMSRASDSGDTAARAAVKNCGGNARVAWRRAWIESGFVKLVMER